MDHLKNNGEQEMTARPAYVWERGKNRVLKKFKFFLLKFNMVCTFWIILMC
jgi:hypothetical protein